MASAGTALHVGPTFNPEEAAHAANEFVLSLDNLPGEVGFLLAEIKEKDTRINSLLNRINQRHYGLTKHKISASTPAPSPPFTLPIAPGSPLPVAHLSSKDAQAIGKLQVEWAKVEALQDEKIKLAERMERIINRAQARGRAEWARVGGMDIEEIEKIEGTASGLGRIGLGELGGGELMLPPGGLGSGTDRIKMLDMAERELRAERTKPPALPLPPSFSNIPILHPPPSAMMPPPLSGTVRTGGISAAGRHRKPRRRSPDPSEDDDDAEGEAEDAEEASGMMEDDDTVYCICEGKVGGDQMIGCDNTNCEIEWFHCVCVGVDPEVIPDKWYCPNCVSAWGLKSSTDYEGFKKKQKSRKKDR